MGGALAVHVAASGRMKGIIGVAVIDVVEGTAMEALTTMKHFLKSRPQKFGSVGGMSTQNIDKEEIFSI